MLTPLKCFSWIKVSRRSASEQPTKRAATEVNGHGMCRMDRLLDYRFDGKNMSPITLKIYELVIEPLLRRWKTNITALIRQTPQAVLDVCCGIGAQCRMIRPPTPVIGVDLDLSALRHARRLSPKVSFVCADAAHLPFRRPVFQAAVLSLALHDKAERLRRDMIGELLPLLAADGKIILLDFERPCSVKSRIGYAVIWLIERLAGREHFGNGREFVRRGGLSAFLCRLNLPTETVHQSVWGSSSIRIVRPGRAHDQVMRR